MATVGCSIGIRVKFPVVRFCVVLLLILGIGVLASLDYSWFGLGFGPDAGWKPEDHLPPDPRTDEARFVNTLSVLRDEGAMRSRQEGAGSPSEWFRNTVRFAERLGTREDSLGFGFRAVGQWTVHYYLADLRRGRIIGVYTYRAEDSDAERQP